MKLTLATTRPLKPDGLAPLDVQGLGCPRSGDFRGRAISEVEGFDDRKGQPEIYRGEEYQVGFLPEAKREIVVARHPADGVIEVIAKAVLVGERGIFVADTEETIRARNREVDAAVL